MKPIRLSAHALGHTTRRGFTIGEVEQAIRTQLWEPAPLGRFECRMDLAFRREWNGKFYSTKQVRPIFVDEESEIVVVTVYTYFY
jgi:hypothetical protein